MGVGMRNVRCIGSWGPNYQQGKNFSGWDLGYWVYSRLFITRIARVSLNSYNYIIWRRFHILCRLTNAIKHTYFVEFNNIFIMFIFFSIICDLNMKNNIWHMASLSSSNDVIFEVFHNALTNGSILSISVWISAFNSETQRFL